MIKINKRSAILLFSAFVLLPLFCIVPDIFAAESAGQPAVSPGPSPRTTGAPAVTTPRTPATQPTPTPRTTNAPESGAPTAFPAAQVAPPPASAPQTMPARPLARPRPSSQGGSSSFFFDDADVFEVIQTVFGEALRVNYIIDPAIKGRVNFRTTTPIPRDRILPVMEIILRLNGIAVVEESGLYRIIPIGNISKEPAPVRFGKDPETVELRGTALMQIVPMTHISSTEMAAILTPLLTQGGALHDISKRNMLIIADTDANVRRLLQVVATFDKDARSSTNQPRIYVHAVQNSKAKNVSEILHHLLLGGGAPTSSSSTSSSSSLFSSSGVKSITGGTSSTTPAAPAAPRAGPVSLPKAAGSTATGDTLVSPNTKIYPDEINNSLVILATPADYSIILAAIKQIDVIPRQVMIEAVVASVTLDDNLTFGLKWNARVDANANAIKGMGSPTALAGVLGFQNISALTAGSFGYQLTDKYGGVRLQIEALAALNKAKILSSPQLLVADNKEAKIQVGSQIPLATSTTTTPLTSTDTNITNTTTSTIQYKDIGTILTVKPQINDSGLVSLELKQEVSGAELAKVLGTDQYVITKNEVTSNLIVQDGETIIIGGLVFETAADNKDGIPFISKIPILSFLAGSVTDNKKRQEMIILLTPRVVRNPAEAKKLTSSYAERFRNVEKEVNLNRFIKVSVEESKPDVKGAPGKPAAAPQGVTAPAAKQPQVTPAASKPAVAPAAKRAPRRAPVTPAAQTPAAAPGKNSSSAKQPPVAPKPAPAVQKAPATSVVQPPVPKPAAATTPVPAP